MQPKWRVQVQFLAVLLLAGCVGPLFAQQAAELVGTVRDQTGRVVPNAKVKATDQATGLSREETTNSAGNYELTPLAPSKYTLEISAPGFKIEVEKDLVLEVNQVARVDVTLQVGQTTQQVLVQAAPPVLATENATNGEVIENQRMIEMPLDGRNFMDLARLTPGVGQDTGAAGGVFINGGGSQSASLIQIDGVDNYESAFGRPNIFSSIDAIQEFKIQTSNYGADQGRASIAQINMITKTGTNNFHGAVYEFNRVENLAALPLFSLTPAQRVAEGLSPVPPYIRNQYGASIGGPIKRDKTFFFFNYEGLKIRQTASGVLTVPTAALRQGDFSGTGTTVYDPLTINAATGARQAFANDQIPMNRLDPVYGNYLGFEPMPNGSGLVNNYTASLPYNQNAYQLTASIQHNFSSHDLLTGRYIYNHLYNLEPGFLGSVLFPGFGEYQYYLSHNQEVRWTHTFNPQTVNELLVGFNRWIEDRYHQHTGTNISAALGLTNTGMPAAQLDGGFPSLSVAGFAVPYEHPYAPVINADSGLQVNDKLTHEFTHHSLYFGGEWVAKRVPLDFHAADRGTYSFGSVYTTPTALGPGSIYNAWGDFALGLPYSTSRAFGWPDNTNDSNWESLYTQDDWRIRPNLTINLGLRWETFYGPVERFNRYNTFNIRELTFEQVGIDGVPRAGFSRPWHDLAPRIGFAWRPFGNKTVVRGGYGIFYDYRVSNTFFNMGQAPPWQFVQPFPGNQVTPNLSFEDPFPGPIPTTPTAADEVTGTAVSPNYHLGYEQQYSLGVQREVFRNTVLDVSYVGNRGIDLNGPGWNINYVTPGLSPNILSREVWPQFNGITWVDNSGMAWYDSMQVRFERRLSRAVTYAVAYTWSHSLIVGCAAGTQNECAGFENPTDFRASKGPGPDDIRNRLVFNFVAELPVGKGRWLMGSAGQGLNLLVGGWELTGIATLDSGEPLTATLNYDNTNGAGGSRPDAVGDPNQGAPHTINQWFNTSAFVAPPTLASIIASGESPWRSQGDAGAGTIIGPPLRTVNLGLFKRFPMPWREQAIQLRLEAFSAFNHPILGSPNTGFPVNGATGTITSASGSRTVQIGARYEF